MKKRKKFHELRYPNRGVSKGRNSPEQTLAMPASATQKRKTTEAILPAPAASESTSGKICFPEVTPEQIERSDRGLRRISRLHGVNVPEPEDEKKVENPRACYDGSMIIGDSVEDSLIILTDIETGFFRECVQANDGGGWYGGSNCRHLERYGLSPYEPFKEQHIPVFEERERDNLLVGLIYRKAYHRSTANIPAFGKSVKILVQECWFKCYLPWRCLERDIPRSVDVANNILQELEPEITKQAQIVQTKIKTELRLRKASGEYDGDAVFGPAGVSGWAALPVPMTRDELNGLEAFYEEDRTADRRVNEKSDAHDKGTLGPKWSYGLNDVWDRETSLEDLQKRLAAR